MHLTDARRRESTAWLFWERWEHLGLAPPFCELGKGHTGIGMRETLPKESSYAAVLGRERKGLSCVLHSFGCGVLPAELSSSLYCCKELLCPSCRTSHLSLSNEMRFLLTPSPSCSGLSEWQFCPGTCQSLYVGDFGVSCRLDEVHTLSTFMSLTKILNCPDRSLRNSVYKSLQVEYESFKHKKTRQFFTHLLIHLSRPECSSLDTKVL